MKSLGACTLLLLTSAWGAAADDNINWLLKFDAKASPQSQGWQAVGGLAAGAKIVNGALQILDESGEDMGAFRATWTPDPSREIVVEARVRVESVKGRKGGTSIWPWTEGAPAGLLVSDGRHQEGIVLRPEKVATFLDRVALMDGKKEFHDYRLVIHGNDMAVFVDGKLLIRGADAFWKKAASKEAFVQFGSNSRTIRGESYWQSVRLGVRKPTSVPRTSKLKITLSEPWDIPSPELKGTGYEILHKHTRPFVHDMGRGLLLMSVAQGPDAVMEPYGVLKSTDQGKTWQPIKGMQAKSFAPQSLVRLPDGHILGVSRWTARYAREEGVYIGMSYRFDPKAESFTMFESLVRVPEGQTDWLSFNRDIYTMANGDIIASVYGSAKGGRRSMLLKSSDGGATWTHYSTLGPRPEPSVVRLPGKEMTALLRVNGWMPFEQIWSQDEGKTWTKPVYLEEGSVDPDMVYMSNGVLACSYGRPGSNLMFSTDKGKTWTDHRTITDARGYNYTAVREVSPGRLLYIHDGGGMQALYVDVKRLD